MERNKIKTLNLGEKTKNSQLEEKIKGFQLKKQLWATQSDREADNDIAI